jgi:hypothetical protein
MKKRLISFIPFKRTTISTSLTHEQIVDLFSNAISPQWDPVWGIPPKNIKKIQGTVSRMGFSVRATDYYRGSLTYLEGKFLPDKKGTKVEVYVTGLLYFTLPFIGIVSLCGFIASVFANNSVGTTFGLLGIIISSIGPFLEADTLDYFLGELLEKFII